MRYLTVVVAALVAIAACSQQTTPDARRPTSSPAATPSLTPELAEAIRFRSELGLRSDLEFVRAVAADPRASSNPFGVPLLPEEVAELESRGRDAEAATSAIRREASTNRDEYGGVYIDQQAGGVVVSLWTANLAGHEAAVRDRLDPRVKLAFRLVAFTEDELADLQDSISADLEWLSEIPAAIQLSEVNVIRNRVDVYLSSAIPGAAAAFLEHYAAPPGSLHVESDGTGNALLPWGTVRARVVTAAGAPPGQNDFYVNWRSETRTYCGVGDMGYGVGEDGLFELPCQSGPWTIFIEEPIGTVIGQADVVVPPDGVVDVVIRLSR